MQDKKIGVCITGSFCTFSQILPVMERLARDNQVTAILSSAAATTDTRFYKAEDFRREVQRITGRPPMTTIAGFAEGLLDGTIPKENEEKYLAVLEDPDYETIYENHGWDNVKDFIDEFETPAEGREFVFCFR
mgnify:CR=1 FL=1